MSGNGASILANGASGKTALLVIDVQVSMFDPEMPPHEGGVPLIVFRQQHAEAWARHGCDAFAGASPAGPSVKKNVVPWPTIDSAKTLSQAGDSVMIDSTPCGLEN